MPVSASQPPPATPDDPVKVLYIAGLPRTGSTILANILGEIEGFFSAGEIRYIPAPSPPCACGAPVTRCSTWERILKEVFETEEEAGERLRPDPAWFLARRLPLLVLRRRRGDERLARYQQTLGELCRAIRRTTGARVIIETSKRPVFGWILATSPGIDVYVVHMVRDPRATAYSVIRSKTWRGAGPLEVGAVWTLWHWLIPRLLGDRPSRYLALRYEDFVSSPRETVLRILGHVHERAGELPFVDDRTVRLGPNHLLYGNPSRFQTGLVEIRPDDDWRTELGWRRELAATALAWPLLHRFGYPLRA